MKEKLLTHCRFYQGNDNDKPNGDDGLICWTAEQAWISRTLEDKEDAFDLDAYIHAGLKDLGKYDGVPVTLKVMLFSFFCKLNERVDAEAFKKFYLKNYA